MALTAHRGPRHAARPGSGRHPRAARRPPPLPAAPARGRSRGPTGRAARAARPAAAAARRRGDQGRAHGKGKRMPMACRAPKVAPGKYRASPGAMQSRPSTPRIEAAPVATRTVPVRAGSRRGAFHGGSPLWAGDRAGASAFLRGPQRRSRRGQRCSGPMACGARPLAPPPRWPGRWSRASSLRGGDVGGARVARGHGKPRQLRRRVLMRRQQAAAEGRVGRGNVQQ